MTEREPTATDAAYRVDPARGHVTVELTDGSTVVLIDTGRGLLFPDALWLSTPEDARRVSAALEAWWERLPRRLAALLYGGPRFILSEVERAAIQDDGRFRCVVEDGSTWVERV